MKANENLNRITLAALHCAAITDHPALRLPCADAALGDRRDMQDMP